MNETHNYDPETFHPSITHSVYVTLEGSRLHLAHPRAKIPRWAAFDETPREAAFLCSRAYQLANCKVSVSAKGILISGSQQSSHVPQTGVKERERQGDLSLELFALISLQPLCHLTRR